MAAQVDNPEALNTIYNVACGARTDLMTMFNILRKYLAQFDPAIASIDAVYGPERIGDVPHSLADISKAKRLLGYSPRYNFEEGCAAAAEWYYRNLKV